jgi:phage terminase large subunit-like protein
VLSSLAASKHVPSGDLNEGKLNDWTAKMIKHEPVAALEEHGRVLWKGGT